MRKVYKSDEDLINKLMKTRESSINFDRTWNDKYHLIRCGGCIGPILGHRAEKCRKVGGGYEEALVLRFEREVKSCPKNGDTEVDWSRF